jgi:hypothetical protein
MDAYCEEHDCMYYKELGCPICKEQFEADLLGL